MKIFYGSPRDLGRWFQIPRFSTKKCRPLECAGGVGPYSRRVSRHRRSTEGKLPTPVRPDFPTTPFEKKTGTRRGPGPLSFVFEEIPSTPDRESSSPGGLKFRTDTVKDRPSGICSVNWRNSEAKVLLLHPYDRDRGTPTILLNYMIVFQETCHRSCFIYEFLTITQTDGAKRGRTMEVK